MERLVLNSKVHVSSFVTGEKTEGEDVGRGWIWMQKDEILLVCFCSSVMFPVRWLVRLRLKESGDFTRKCLRNWGSEFTSNVQRSLRLIWHLAQQMVRKTQEKNLVYKGEVLLNWFALLLVKNWYEGSREVKKKV